MSPQSAAKDTRTEKAQRLKEEGFTIGEIAQRMKLPRALVQNLLETPEAPPRSTGMCESVARGLLAPPMSFGEQNQLAVYQRIEDTAWKQWEASCRPKVVVTERTTVTETGSRTTITTQKAQRPGDIRFLNLALRTAVLRHKTESPIQRECSEEVERQLEQKLAEIPPEELDTILKGSDLMQGLMRSCSETVSEARQRRESDRVLGEQIEDESLATWCRKG